MCRLTLPDDEFRVVVWVAGAYCNCEQRGIERPVSRAENRRLMLQLMSLGETNL